MKAFDNVAALLDAPDLIAAEPRPAGLGRAGLLGYAAGTLGLFSFLRLYGVLPPGLMSYLVVLLFVLAGNFFLAGVTHLFLDLTGERGGAGRLFLAYGLSDYLLALLVPLGLFAKLGGPGAFLWFCAAVGALLWARVRLLRRLYPVSRNKAALAVCLPYAGLSAALFLAFVYWVAWLVWLVA